MKMPAVLKMVQNFDVLYRSHLKIIENYYTSSNVTITKPNTVRNVVPLSTIRAIFPSLRRKAQQENSELLSFPKKITELNMECVYFPDIYSITSVAHRTIDVFATIIKSLEVNFNSETADFPRQQIKSIMQKIVAYRQNVEFPEINKLFYLLSEMVLGIVGAHETASNSSACTKKSVAERIQNKVFKLVSSSDSILPIPTLDQIETEEFYTKIDEMNKLMRTHKNIYRDLQRQQEVCWINNSKVQKYEICLKTAEMSRNHLADKLSSKNLKARDNSITQLQTTLTDKKQKAAESAKKYLTLLTKEKMTRNAMRTLESDLLDDIRFTLTDRIHSGLLSMKYILTTQTNILCEVLQHIDDFDCRLAAELIIEKLSSTYQFSSPQKFHAANSFNVRLPDIQYVNYKSGIHITKEQPSELTTVQRNNNNVSCQENQFKFLYNSYVKTKDLSEKTNECFKHELEVDDTTSRANIKKKMWDELIVKLKFATDESEVVFGWYPWNQKKWGFFRKSTENRE